MTEPVNVLIGTPAYAGMVHVDFVSTLLSFTRARIPFTLLTIGNESLITRARNAIAAAFLERAEFTHLLFLDGDVSLSPEDARRLLAYDKDVVGAPVALKARRPDGSLIFNVGRSLGEEGALIVTEHVGTAVLLLSRRAVTALASEAQRAGYVYESVALRGENNAKIHYDIFRVGVVDGNYLSEDFWACRSLRRLGFRIYIDPTVVTTHIGTIPV
jgi:hypothetical protein